MVIVRRCVTRAGFTGALFCVPCEIRLGSGQAEEDDCQIPGDGPPKSVQATDACHAKDAIEKKDNRESVVAPVEQDWDCRKRDRQEQHCHHDQVEVFLWHLLKAGSLRFGGGLPG